MYLLKNINKVITASFDNTITIFKFSIPENVIS